LCSYRKAANPFLLAPELLCRQRFLQCGDEPVYVGGHRKSVISNIAVVTVLRSSDIPEMAMGAKAPVACNVRDTTRD
jgi:hypothetical protein